ncbi:MAG: hypothetical protein HUU19_12100 [Phycisphaerales bacterium]|nr:hypothetical protein [Phycisphaerales bacterium]
MNIDFGQRECEFCKRYTLTVRRRCDHGVHLLLTLATGGLWLGVWALAWAFGPGPRCTGCGAEKPLMRTWFVLGPALALSAFVLLIVLRVATSPQYRQRILESPTELLRPFQQVKIERPK